MTEPGAKAAGHRAVESGPAIVGIACHLPSAPDAVSYWSQTTGLGEDIGDAVSPDSWQFSQDAPSSAVPGVRNTSPATAPTALQSRRQATAEASRIGTTAAAIVEQAFRDASVGEHSEKNTTVTVSCSSRLTAATEAEITQALRQVVHGSCAVNFSSSFIAAMQSAATEIERGACELAVAVAVETPFAAAIVMTSKQLIDEDALSTTPYCTISGTDSAQPPATSQSGKETPLGVEPLTMLTCVCSHDDAAPLRAIRHFETKLGKAQAANACVIDQIEASSSLPGTLAEAVATIKSAMALFHRTLPPSTVRQQPPPPWFANDRARTWIHPKVHPKVWSSHGSGEMQHARRAAIFAALSSSEEYTLTLAEYDDPHEAKRKTLQRTWDSELIVLSGAAVPVLMRKLDVLEDYIVHNSAAVTLRQIAATMSSECQVKGLHLAIVTTSTADLLDKIQAARQQLTAPYSIPPPGTTGIYLPCDDAVRAGKTALILPGLGAAYPNMLAELCLHFSDVRAVFDFVDQLALSAGETLRPSKLIFPWPANAQNSPASTALLASMDSAVVTVLMAEYALFMILSNMGIKPDLLIGCSTGEFAALTISGATDIINVAPMFYRLSTSIARSVPKSSLANLRTIKVNADFAQVEPAMKGLNELYLSADLSPIQHLISGSRESMSELCKRLDAAGIEFIQLPLAIPYHTPLVAGVIDADNPEIKELDLVAPAVPTWSCSSASQYPQDVDEIRQITTELFTHPILLKQSVQQAYAQGITKFIEVGPKGTLTPVVGEILAGRSHLAVAANVSTGSAITALNHMLAALASADVELSLSHSYWRRPDHLSALSAALASCTAQSDGTEYELDNEISCAPLLEDDSSAAAQVVHNYLTGMSAFHEQLMSVQGDVMSAYLLSAALPDDEESYDHSSEYTYTAPAIVNDLAFLKRGIVTGGPVAGRAELTLHLNLDEHRYLLDHAIGGAVSHQHRVYLLPLTVAMEIMAETAAVLMPELVPIALESIRAARRIRVGSNGCDIRVVAVLNQDRPLTATVQIYSSGETSTNEPAMSCDIRFCDRYPQPPVAARFEEQSSRPSTIAPEKLYSTDNMFHGPLLQSVKSIEALGEKSICARLAIRPAENWFSNESIPPRFLCDPLLLDNATQAVFFFLLEHRQEAASLLPFFIDSLELFHDLSAHSGEVEVNVVVRANTATGTECDITIGMPGQPTLAKFNRLCHRRITLPQAWKPVVISAGTAFLTAEMTVLTQALPQSPMWSASRLRDDRQIDDAILAWCADYLLSEGEQEFFWHLSNARRRREWMLGRIALKDAVRRLAAAYGVSPICPAEIETHQQPDGSPGIGSQTVELLGWRPIVSLAHKAGVAIAIAGHPDAARAVGIDLENIETREQGFEKFALTADERAGLANSTPDEVNLAIAKIWCAKEAVGKALGIGLSNNPKSLETIGVDAQSSDRILVRRTGTGSQSEFCAHVFSDGDEVFAVCPIE